MSPTPLLELDGVTKTFGPVTALTGVSLACEAGTVHALVGENGAGKSTLLGVLGGHVTPSAGSMRLGSDDVDLDRFSPHQAQELGITIIHQEIALIPALSVVDNIFLGRELGRARLDHGAMRRKARAALDELGADDIDELQPVEGLSVAQAQLVEIARALVFETRVLALDEPSAVLAGEELDALFDVVRRLRGQGVAIIYVSHRLDEIFALADTYTVLKDGAVAGEGDVVDVTHDEIIRMMVGRDIEDIFPPKASSHGDVLLEVRGLHLDDSLHDINLTAHRGEILGLAGLIGSGRTTLAKTIFGAIPPTAGTIRVGYVNGPFGSPRTALNAGLAYLPEDRKSEGLALEKTVSDNVTLLHTNRLKSVLGLIDKQQQRATATRTIERFSIRTDASGRDPVQTLSGGNQQKVVVGKWMLPDPEVLILDEPTRGIDVGAKQQIYTLLRELADAGKCIVVISSELVEIIGLCDRVMVLCEGRVAGELTGDQISEEAVMRLATRGQPVEA